MNFVSWDQLQRSIRAWKWHLIGVWVRDVLKKTHGNIKIAAKSVKMDRGNFYRIVRETKVRLEKYRHGKAK